MEKSELEIRFTYHPPKDGQPAKYTALRDAAKAMAVLIWDLVPENREKALAITALEEAVMWANAGIARGERVSGEQGKAALSPDQIADLKRTIFGITLEPEQGGAVSFVEATSKLVIKKLNDMVLKSGNITAGV